MFIFVKAVESMWSEYHLYLSVVRETLIKHVARTLHPGRKCAVSFIGDLLYNLA